LNKLFNSEAEYPKHSLFHVLILV